MTYYLTEPIYFPVRETDAQNLAEDTGASWMSGVIERQRAKKQLYEMTDRELSDLGISRSEIDAVVDGPERTARKARPFILTRLYRSAVAYSGRKMKERAGYRALKEMDARQLADLGLTRNDKIIQGVAKCNLPVARNDNQPAAQNDNGRRHAV